MYKKGFTLVELLGVITVLGIILAISVPSVTGILKKQKENEYNRFLSDLFLATDVYLEKHDEEFPSLSQVNGKAIVSLHNLVSDKLIKSTTIHPKTNEKINLNHSIKVTIKEDHTYHYEYLDHNATIDGYVKDQLFLLLDGYNKPALDGSKLIWNDMSGNQHKGTMIGFDTKSGWNGIDGIQFDGTNDYIEMDFRQSALGQKFTIDMVARLDDCSNYRGLFGPHISTGSYGSPSKIRGYTCQCGSNLLGISAFTNNSGNGISLTSLQYQLGHYINITYVVDGGVGTKLYINGNFMGSTSVTEAVNPDDDYVFWIAKSFPAMNRYFLGTFDSFKIYKKVLNENEITQNYKVNQTRFTLG